MEQWKKVASAPCHMDASLRHLSREHMAPGCTMRRGWAVEAAIHFTLTRAMYPSIVADHEHPFMDTRFPDSSSFGSIMCSAPQQKWLRNGRMSTTIRLRRCLGLKSSDLSLSKRGVLDEHFWPVQLTGLKKHLQITSCCQIPQHTSMARDYFGPEGRSTGRCVDIYKHKHTWILM